MEQSFLAYLKGRTRGLPQVAVGIGDDAAVIELPPGATIACADQIIDGVDFASGEHDLSAVGEQLQALRFLFHRDADAARDPAGFVAR